MTGRNDKTLQPGRHASVSGLATKAAAAGLHGAGAMSSLGSLLRAAIALLVGLSLTACSKTVQWEEEVPLNTGETIWVKRKLVYSIKGGADNPLDLRYRPDWTETIVFEWQGRRVSYTGAADLMLLAISPVTKQPVLVAPADNNGWDLKNHYRCTTPFYVQFNPDPNGRNWTWPASIEPWLYGLPYNLMAHKPSLNDVRARYTARDRAEADWVLIAHPDTSDMVRIDPTRTTDACKRRGNQHG